MVVWLKRSINGKNFCKQEEKQLSKNILLITQDCIASNK